MLDLKFYDVYQNYGTSSCAVDSKLSGANIFYVTLYSYCGGVPKESLQFFWKCGSVLDIQQANKVIHIIENSIDVYHTRAMRKEFHEKFGLISKAHPTVLNGLYRYLTDDSTVPQSDVSKKSAQSSTCSKR